MAGILRANRERAVEIAGFDGNDAARLYGMPLPSIARLCRYPVKGFVAQDLIDAPLKIGAGIPFDRRFAITNAQLDIGANGAWTACQAFVRLTKNSALPSFDIHFEEQQARLNIRHPGGDGLSIALDDKQSIIRANAILKKWFPVKGAGSPQLVEASNSTGYWDHEDAAISIINIESVTQLGHSAERMIDPMRLRGNLLLSGLPAWEELAWPGYRVQIGEAVLEVLRPIDRCSATSVHPVSGGIDMNVPAMLARQTGHVFCGVYARVVKAGRVRVGDAARVISISHGARVRASQTATAPSVATWPRAGQIVAASQDTADVSSFWISDPLFEDGIAPAFRAGQHLRLHGLSDGKDKWRSYTISAVRDDGSLRISVKREQHGACSSWLHTHWRIGDRVLFSGPFGEFQLPTPVPEQIVMLSAGIGITPMLAMLSHLVRSGAKTWVWLVHVARNFDELAFWPEVLEASLSLPNVKIDLYLSQQHSPPKLRATQRSRRFLSGRPNLDALAQEFALKMQPIFICGPDGFTRQALASLQRAGCSPESIHHEVFVSPKSKAATRFAPIHPGPFEVEFEISKIKAVWRESDGSLLDLAERHGLNLPANCRSGACMACNQTLKSGQVAYTTDPLMAVSAPGVLMCCSVPVSHLAIAA